MERLSSILARLKLPGPGPLQMEQVGAALRQALGEEATRGLRVLSFKRGRLVLEAASAARAFELQAFARSALVQRLRGSAGLEGLTDVAVQVGAWRRHGSQ